MTMKFTTIGYGTTSAALLQARAHLQAVEASQPEGTPMQLVLSVNPVVASKLNYTAAQINHQTSIKGVLPWTGSSDVAFVTSSNAVTLRWRKGQPWIVVIIGILLVTAVIWYYLEGWRFEKGELVNVNTGQKESPSQFLTTQLPQIASPSFLALAAGLVVGGVILAAVFKRETSTQVFQARAYSRAQGMTTRAQIRSQRRLASEDRQAEQAQMRREEQAQAKQQRESRKEQATQQAQRKQADKDYRKQTAPRMKGALVVSSRHQPLSTHADYVVPASDYKVK